VETFNQAASERLWTILNAAKGPQTEGDAERAMKTYAKLSNTKQANEFILDLIEAQAYREQKRFGFYNDALPIAQRTGDLMEIERRWSRVPQSIWSMPSMQKWSAYE
jgi:hypothetical protein